MAAATIHAKRVLTTPEDAPRAAHKFLFTRVGVDIVLEIGHFDLHELREAMNSLPSQTEEARVEVPLYITARYTLSPQSVTDLVGVAKLLDQDIANIVSEVASAEKKGESNSAEQTRESGGGAKA